MNIHRIAIAAPAIILITFTFGVAAQPGNNHNAGRTGQSQHNNNPGMHQSVDTRAQGRDNAARGHDADWNQSRQGNENSNRQSDPDSTRGLERAEERRSENAAPRGQAEKKSHWYGKDKKAEGDMERGYETAERKKRWWWPFD